MGKVALVTGASRGLGRAFAEQLGRDGVHIYALARTVGALEELDDTINSGANSGGARATLVPLDLTVIEDPDPLLRLAATILERHGRLDILFAAAGVMPKHSTAAQQDTLDWQRAMALNLEANRRLIRYFDPLLQRSAQGRAFFVSDTLADKPRAYLSAYGASKSALESLVCSWGLELRGSSTSACVVRPPVFQSRLRVAGWPGEDQSRYPSPKTIATVCLQLLADDSFESGEKIDLNLSAED
ncbi:MAG: SDR family oxidoreductase [Alphaproteobacteria bacterium]